MIDKTDILCTFEKSYHISYNSDFFCCVGANVNLYDSKSGELIFKFKDIKHPCFSKFMTNQTLVVKTSDSNYYVFDLVSMELVKKIPPPKKALGTTTGFQITSDNKYILDFFYIFPKRKLMTIDIETGKYTFFDLGNARSANIFATENKSKYYVVSNCAETIDAPDICRQEYYELIYTSNKFKLKKIFFDKVKAIFVDYSSNKFAVANCSYKIKWFDTQQNFIDELHYNKGALYGLKLSKDGRYLALAQSRSICIFDLMNKACVKNYEVEYGCFVDFLDERLLIGTWEKGYCVKWLS